MIHLPRTLVPGAALLFLLTSIIFVPFNVRAQDPTPREEIEKREQLEQQRRTQLEQSLSEHLKLKYGGWSRYSYFAIEDEDGLTPANDRFFRELDSRLWFDLKSEDVHQLYGRFEYNNRDYSPGDRFHPAEDTKTAEIDQLYYKTDLDQSLYNLIGVDPNLNLRGTTGRQPFTIGRGLVYDRVHDGVTLTMEQSDVQLSAFGARSDLVEEFDIDLTRPDFDDSERLFYGGELTYNGISRVQPYAYTVIQRDLNEAEDTPLSFDYDSEYFGVGTRAEVLKNVSVNSEFVAQRGKSTTGPPENTREDIHAHAYFVTATYYMETSWQPTFEASYMHGSGDEDRLDPSDTIGGNTAGSSDRGFVPFGYIFTGYSLNPRLSNIKIMQAGVDVRPFRRNPEDSLTTSFEEIEVGLDFFRFRKVEKEGGISDIRAINEDRDLGWEIDSHLNWRIFSDTLLQIRYGILFQGDAYLSDDQRSFFSSHITIEY